MTPLLRDEESPGPPHSPAAAPNTQVTCGVGAAPPTRAAPQSPGSRRRRGCLVAGTQRKRTAAETRGKNPGSHRSLRPSDPFDPPQPGSAAASLRFCLLGQVRPSPPGQEHRLALPSTRALLSRSRPRRAEQAEQTDTARSALTCCPVTRKMHPSFPWTTWRYTWSSTRSSLQQFCSSFIWSSTCSGTEGPTPSPPRCPTRPASVHRRAPRPYAGGSPPMATKAGTLRAHGTAPENCRFHLGEVFCPPRST